MSTFFGNTRRRAAGICALLLFLTTDEARANEVFPYNLELSLVGKVVEGARRNPGLSVSVDGTARGSLWCNIIGGLKAQVRANEISIRWQATTISTLEYCGSQVHAEEKTLLRHIENSVWTVVGKQLHLRNAAETYVFAIGEDKR